MGSYESLMVIICGAQDLLAVPGQQDDVPVIDTLRKRAAVVF